MTHVATKEKLLKIVWEITDNYVVDNSKGEFWFYDDIDVENDRFVLLGTWRKILYWNLIAATKFLSLKYLKIFNSSQLILTQISLTNC